MSKLYRMSRTPGLVSRFVLLSLAACLLVAAAPAAQAQTAPQLLPYNSVLIAGSGTAAIAKGATCPVSGYTSTDAYGDGCLATEVSLATTSTSGSGPRYAVVDRTGAVFLSDSSNGLVRRVDPVTGIITAVAGGAATSPTTGATCGTAVSTSTDGDGCLGTAVHLSHPMGLVFDAAGNLYFVDEGFDNIRKIAATGGVITTSGTITHIAGNTTYGYNVNNTAPGGTVIAATQSYLNFPYGLAIDAAGNLYVGDEGNNAIEVINIGTATQTIQGLVVPAGTIAKFAGYGNLAAKTAQSGDCPDFVSTTARGGCYFGKWTDGALANVSNIDAVYSIAVNSAGSVYIANEFNDDIGLITPANVISNYAGIQGSVLKKTQRGPAGSFAAGSPFGVAVDADNNVYYTDASNGVVWRVDGAGKSMYVVAGGAATVCTAATDTYGDGCPATQATFGSSGTTFASTTLPGPGIFGVSVDAFADLFVGDTVTGTIREVASGTQFGVVGANQPTNTIAIHFAASDSALASGAYTLTSGSSNFSLGTAACTTNSDNTTDCLLPITATPSTLGPFTGNLQVKSTLGGTANFPLSGNYVVTPLTRTAVGINTGVTCSGSSAVATTTPVKLTATIASSGTPTGTVTFFANGTQIGTPQPVTNGVSTLTYTFSTPNTYAITATYSGDSYFKPSTGKGSTTVTSSTPGFTVAATTNMQATVVQGQTALYAFTIAQNVYSGTLSFACSGLPANTACSFSPSTLTATGCTTTSTVALSIITQGGGTKLSGFGGAGRGPWQTIAILPGLLLALLVGFRRRSLRFAPALMMLALLLATTGLVACGKGLAGTATPVGSTTITVTTTGSTGTVTSFTVPLNVTAAQ